MSKALPHCTRPSASDDGLHRKEEHAVSAKKHLKTIDSFFRPVSLSFTTGSRKTSPEHQTSPEVFNEHVLPALEGASTSGTQTVSCVKSVNTHCTSLSPNFLGLPDDIGNFVGKNISDFQKFLLIENPWKPPPDYKFPFSIHNKNGKEVRRFVGHQHLEKYNWLVFSPSKQGLFCRYCPWFTVGNVAGGQNTVQLQKLVTKPLIKFAKLLGGKEDLVEHANKKYHKEAVLSAKLFLQTYKAPELDVRNRIDKQRCSQVEDNRGRLKPIIESIIFLGRQNIPLRGHRDDGRLDPAASVGNEGNFRELLRFRVKSGDKVLEEHLKNSSSRATYISKSTQHELINCCGELVLSKILGEVQEATFYSVLFDETTDLSHKSQISLVLRYYSDGMIKEDFVGFIDAFNERNANECETISQTQFCDEMSLTGERLGQIVLNKLKNLGLSLKNCIGIGTDGCSVMLSQVKGAVVEIQKEATNAIRSPCYNHALTLSLSKCNGVTEIRNAVGIMKEVTGFFSSSAKRNHVLKKHLGSQLSGLCETRWVERHDGVIQFNSDLPKIIAALDEVSSWNDTSASSKASVLSTALTSSTFLVALVCLSDVLALTLPLSKSLQKPCFSLCAATSVVSDTISVLNKRRVEAENYFSGLWKHIKDLAHQVGVHEILLPRLCERQTQRAIFGAGKSSASPDAYYRTLIFIPLLDFIISDLSDRFSHSTLELFHLSFILPKEIRSCMFYGEEKADENENSSIESVIKLFLPLLNLNTQETSACVLLKGEFSIWKQKWKESLNPPQELLDALQECDVDVFPLIRRLLLIMVTLPVSVASCERSFSALRRLKSWLRTRMTQERLNGLALLHVHRDTEISIEEVIDKFANTSKRTQFII